MSGIEVGLKGEKEMVVQLDDLASVMGNVGAQVLSTHQVVLLMELAARNAIKDSLPPGMMTVGTMIRIRHFAAAPMGMKVRTEATLKEIDGHRLIFDVTAYDECDKIAEGQNEQLIVTVEKFLKRVEEKESLCRHRITRKEVFPMVDLGHKVSSFWEEMDQFERLIREWNPEGCRTKGDFERSLSKFLKEHLKEKEIVKKVTIGKMKVDLAIGGTVFIQIRKDLQNQGQLERLVSQIDGYSKNLKNLILILCGEVDKDLLQQVIKKGISFFEFNLRVVEK